MKQVFFELCCNNFLGQVLIKNVKNFVTTQTRFRHFSFLEGKEKKKRIEEIHLTRNKMKCEVELKE